MTKFRTNKDYLASELSPFDTHPKGWSQFLAWVYPNSYEVGMANVGYQWLLGKLKRFQHILTERFFYVSGEPLSLESGRNLTEFPVVAVSMPYELDILNFLKMLSHAGITLRAENRPNVPIIIGGGDALTLNPFPVADFFDIIVLGDGEPWAEQFPEILRDMPPGLAGKKKILEAASKIPGVWIPSFGDGDPIRRAMATRREPAFTPILSSFGHFRNMFLVEIQRGCPFDCGFCALRWLGEPFANFPAKEVFRVYDEFGQSAKRVGLVGSAVAEHDELEAIFRGFSERGVSIHPSSIRLDRVSRETLELLAESGLRSVTFAPETASERLARKIGKWISPGKIISEAKELKSMGFREMKLYWILGLPDEKPEDIDAMVSAIRGITDSCDLRISCSVNPFIPKPHTRFSGEPMLAHDDLSARFERLTSQLRGISNLRLEINYSTRSRFSALLSVGDESIAPVLEKIAAGGGIKRALKDFGIDLDAPIRAPENPPTGRIV